MNETFYWAAVWSGLVVSTVFTIVVLPIPGADE